MSQSVTQEQLWEMVDSLRKENTLLKEKINQAPPVQLDKLRRALVETERELEAVKKENKGLRSIRDCLWADAVGGSEINDPDHAHQFLKRRGWAYHGPETAEEAVELLDTLTVMDAAEVTYHWEHLETGLWSTLAIALYTEFKRHLEEQGRLGFDYLLDDDDD